MWTRIYESLYTIWMYSSSVYTHLGGVVAYRVEPRRAPYLLSFPKFWNLFLPLSLMTLLVRVEERDGCFLSNGFVGMPARGGIKVLSQRLSKWPRRGHSIVRIGIDWDRARLDRNYFAMLDPLTIVPAWKVEFRPTCVPPSALSLAYTQGKHCSAHDGLAWNGGSRATITGIRNVGHSRRKIYLFSFSSAINYGEINGYIVGL